MGSGRHSKRTPQQGREAPPTRPLRLSRGCHRGHHRRPRQPGARRGGGFHPSPRRQGDWIGQRPHPPTSSSGRTAASPSTGGLRNTAPPSWTRTVCSRWWRSARARRGRLRRWRRSRRRARRSRRRTPRRARAPPRPLSSSAAGAGPSGSSRPAKAEDPTPLWVNKYKPSAPAQLIGNGKQIADLRRFLSTWEDIHVTGAHPLADAKGKDKPMKAVLISGPLRESGSPQRGHDHRQAARIRSDGGERVGHARKEQQRHPGRRRGRLKRDPTAPAP